MEYNLFDIFCDVYEEWFRKNENIFQSELLAIKQAVPVGKNGIEIGVGSGIFAEQLGVKIGIDPSDKMLDYARKRNLTVDKGIAEDLPYPSSSFDFALFITSICFIGNPSKAMKEAHRILKTNGEIIIAFIDKESLLGQFLERDKGESKFYKNANFYSVSEIMDLLEKNNFKITDIFQTLTRLDNITIEKPLKGYGKGSFVVVKGKKYSENIIFPRD